MRVREALSAVGFLTGKGVSTSSCLFYSHRTTSVRGLIVTLEFLIPRCSCLRATGWLGSSGSCPQYNWRLLRTLRPRGPGPPASCTASHFLFTRGSSHRGEATLSGPQPGRAGGWECAPRQACSAPAGVCTRLPLLHPVQGLMHAVHGFI